MSGWLDHLFQNRAQIIEDVLAQVRAENLTGYLALPEADLRQVLGDAIDARLAGVAGDTEAINLDRFALESGRRRAEQRQFSLRDIIGLSLCIKSVLRQMITRQISDPIACASALDEIERVNDRLLMGISEAFTKVREEAIRQEEASLVSVAEVLANEISKTDQRIQQIEEQIQNTQADLKEMQAFREVLLSRLVSRGEIEGTPA